MLINARSWFSFKYGVLSPEQVLAQVQEDGHVHVALTDINCSAGHSEFFRLANAHGVKPVAGRDLRQDLLRRVPLHVEQARVLVRVGALRFTERTKPRLLWDLAMQHHGRSDAARNGDLFITKVPDPKLPELDRYPLADAYGELELLCFPLSDPFSLLDIVADPAAPGVQPKAVPAREMSACAGQRVQMLGYMIHVKGTDTHTGQRMSFGWFIDTAGDFWDSTQFPDVSARFPFRGRGVHRLVGHGKEEFGHYSLRTQFMETFPWRIDPRYGEK